LKPGREVCLNGTKVGYRSEGEEQLPAGRGPPWSAIMTLHEGVR
jgi:hypothetical protein